MRVREQGSISVMTIGFLIVIGLLTVVVVNASAAFLEKQELNNLADGAALAAADGLDEAGFYTDLEVRLDARQARKLVGEYLAGSDVRAVDVRVADDTVTVRLDRRVSLALAPPGWFDSTTVVAQATSQLRQDD
ncbi:pilus assembly protein TadG-related protein [Aeromicrobium sp. CTD01-1L150]|uniref:pilus assembly protein TadG-related protein n=1 Tax=Aeromicrobium sp. CTD01-1L150 TaxID=3341830 RepID=UPI0035C0F06A